MNNPSRICESRPTAAAPRGRRGVALLVSLFAALLVLPPVGHHLIVKSDEARFALLARDMITRGAWLNAEVEGERYRNKPPLYPWSIAALSLLRGGVTEATAQLPSALAAIAAVCFTFLLGDRLFGRRAGVWASLILVTSGSFFSHSQQILPDVLVVAFATAAGYAFWSAMSADRPGLALVGFYAALAFGLFAKGPVGALPLLVAVIWLLSEHGLRGLARLWSVAGLVVFAAVTLAWLLPFLGGGSQTFGENVLWGDWLVTYLGLPLPRRVASFIVDAFVGFLPWTLLLIIAIVSARREWRNPAVRFALLSFAVPFLVIIVSRSRLPRYLLPVYPGAALLVAWWADIHGARATLFGRVLGWAPPVAGVAALIAFPWLPKLDEPGLTLDAAMLWRLSPLIVVCLAIVFAFLVGLTRGRPSLIVYGGVVFTAIAFGYGAWLFNAMTDRREDFKSMAATVTRHAPSGDVIVFTQAKLLPLDFYLGRELPRPMTVPALKERLGRATSPTVLVDRQNLKVTPPELVQEFRLLETLQIHEQRLYLLGCGAAERSTASPRCAAARQ